MNIMRWSDWRVSVASPQATIEQVTAAVDRGGRHIALILDENQVLRAIMTDGDLRRAQLAGARADMPAFRYAASRPVIAAPSQPHSDYIRLLRKNNIMQLPLVDRDGRLVDVILRDLQPIEQTDTWAVIMAGGFGKRLAPLTDRTPKPLLPVGGIPMIERIIRSLRDSGIRTIVISVFHMSSQVRDFCGDGSRWGVRIIYIEERTPRGTAGALALLKERPRDHLIVINGDILTNISFRGLLNFHREQEHVATMCVHEQRHRVQYGVVKFDGLYIREIQEKPIHSYFVSAGIYVFNPDVLDLIPENQYYDMPSLFRALTETDARPGAFPIRELWLDIGTMADYEKAQNLIGPRRLERVAESGV